MANVEQATDEAVTALLEAHAAQQGGTVAVEQVDGHNWRAGFVFGPDRAGDTVMESAVHAPDKAAALRQLLARTADTLHRSAEVAENRAKYLERAARIDDAANLRREGVRTRTAAEHFRWTALTSETLL